MRTPVAIRDVRASPNEKVEGWLEIGETASGPLRIPLVIINGADDGPRLCFTAGVHATEYAPIDAVMRLIRSVKPAELRGAIIAVPVTNMRMFESRTGFNSPLDGLNLNKIAPGRRDGSISEILADIVLRELIGAAEYHIDFHAGDVGEALYPFAGYSLTGNRELDAKGEALARAFTPCLVSLSPNGSSIPPFAGSLNYSATRNGVVSILAESGGDGTLLEEDVRIHVEGALNVMRHLGMIDGERPRNRARLAACDRVVVRAKRAGLLRLTARIGDEIVAGDQLGEICDVFGRVVERVCAPGTGIVGLIWTHKVVNTGDPILRYWINEPIA
ncbi:MAG TPA: succinylglutamate desuccinylase/aspartoacylase family protein [Gemmatimonadaceae bacterium]|nr:succinylglutamate desuccinylase/aspartoacylase family protein [Gemmatimonadaceae bacterium]